jgi:PAS domain S-box-containing protein
VNAATERIFDTKTDELIGHPVSELVGGIDQAAHHSYVEHYKQTGNPSTPDGLVIGNFREATGQRADGSEFPAELAVAETELADGRKLFVAAIRDITERKQAEAQLQTLNSELETRSHERQALVQQLLSAQEEERRTVAYEIHDGPAQQLAAAQMFLEAFAFDQNIDMEADSADHLQRAKSYLDTGLTETRRIMSGLRPALLDDLGLADALHQLLNELASRAEIQLELDSSKLVNHLAPSVEITLYRIAQEAATNALKHSGSDRLRVDLQSDGSVAQLRVADYGRGFDPNAIEGPRDGHRYGLVGMRERVALLQGQFEIDSAPGQGTVITVTIPLSEED